MKAADVTHLFATARSCGLKLREGRSHHMLLSPASVITEAEVLDLVTRLAAALAAEKASGDEAGLAAAAEGAAASSEGCESSDRA